MRKRICLLILTAAAFVCLSACGQPTEEEPVGLKKLTFNATELVLGVGDTFQLELTLDPINATKGRTVTVASDNPDKVSVNQNFLITAKERGETKIVATSTYGGIFAEVRVVVVPKLEGAMDFIVAVRGTSDTVYLTNDLVITDADLALVGYEVMTLKKPKTIVGNGFRLDLSGLSKATVQTGALVADTDEPVSLQDLTLVVGSAFEGNLDAAIYDPNGVVTKTGVTIAVK